MNNHSKNLKERMCVLDLACKKHTNNCKLPIYTLEIIKNYVEYMETSKKSKKQTKKKDILYSDENLEINPKGSKKNSPSFRMKQSIRFFRY